MMMRPTLRKSASVTSATAATSVITSPRAVTRAGQGDILRPMTIVIAQCAHQAATRAVGHKASALHARQGRGCTLIMWNRSKTHSVCRVMPISLRSKVRTAQEILILASVKRGITRFTHTPL